MSTDLKQFGIGQPVRRKEDIRLVRGRGCYSDDVKLAGQAYAVIVRSPHAHARIRAINASAAASRDGVLAVLSRSDQTADGLRPIPHAPHLASGGVDIVFNNRDGSDIFIDPHFVLATDKVRFVGEPVALVVAESVAMAKDAAEAIEIDYDPLPSVTDTVTAASPDAPRIWEDIASNVLLDAEVGDAAAADAAFATATHVVSLDTWIRRVTGVPMEPRAAVGSFDVVSGRYTVWGAAGGAVRQKHDLASVLGVPPDRVHVVMRDVGGNFGTRGAFYPEFALVAWASKRVGRPVKWTCERHEAFLTDYQGRDFAVSAELALDAGGAILAMRGSGVVNNGGHLVSLGSLRKSVELLPTVYRVPVTSFRARAVFSNTAPTRPYRSAGRPEVMFVMERLLDIAASRHGFDRIALRKRNLVTAAEMPYRNGMGMTYDSGDYHLSMDRALSLGNWADFKQRQAEARERGRYRGLGVANYIEAATGVPTERAEISILAEGIVEVVIGTVSSGQGHETSFAQLVTEWLGVDCKTVRLIAGDTDRVSVGGGTHSGRSMRLASIVIWKASLAIIEKGAAIAAHLLEAAPIDVDFSAGRFYVKGTDRSVGLFEAAAASVERSDLPDSLAGGLAATGDETVTVANFPYGSHVCEVEVDPETGVVEIVRYCAVDDVGRAVNPLILHGQTHGGIAQGVGQALYEEYRFDPDSGQPLTGSFMDYAMPRASYLPSFVAEISEVPSTTHPLGFRGGGEGGTTPSLAVVVNAVVDALSPFGVTHLEMPVTPERVWQAIRTADRSPVPNEQA